MNNFFSFILIILSFNLFASDFLPSTFTVDYEEITQGVTIKKEKHSMGKIDYQYPKHIRFEVVSPQSSLFVSNPEKSWLYTPPIVEGEDGQVVIQPSQKLPMTVLLDQLKIGLVTNKIFNVVFVKNEARLSFSPQTQKDLQLKEVTLVAEGEVQKITQFTQVKTMRLLYLNGQKVRLNFSNLKPQVVFSKDYFVFLVPSKTKITEKK